MQQDRYLLDWYVPQHERNISTVHRKELMSSRTSKYPPLHASNTNDIMDKKD